MKAYKIIVSGRVQGVGFRFFSQQEAQGLNLHGTVRNQSDGTVLIYVQGEDEPLMNFLSWLHQGPKTSKVEQLEYLEIPIFVASSFDIIR